MKGEQSFIFRQREMITERQEEINQLEVEDYDRLIEEQRMRISRMFDFEADSALAYTCSDSTIDDWQDTNEITPKLIIELQRHAKKVAEHLLYLSKLETTEDLRGYSMNRFDVSHQPISGTYHLS